MLRPEAIPGDRREACAKGQKAMGQEEGGTSPGGLASVELLLTQGAGGHQKAAVTELLGKGGRRHDPGREGTKLGFDGFGQRLFAQGVAGGKAKLSAN